MAPLNITVNLVIPVANNLIAPVNVSIAPVTPVVNNPTSPVDLPIILLTPVNVSITIVTINPHSSSELGGEP